VVVSEWAFAYVCYALWGPTVLERAPVGTLYLSWGGSPCQSAPRSGERIRIRPVALPPMRGGACPGGVLDRWSRRCSREPGGATVEPGRARPQHTRGAPASRLCSGVRQCSEVWVCQCSIISPAGCQPGLFGRASRPSSPLNVGHLPPRRLGTLNLP